VVVPVLVVLQSAPDVERLPSTLVVEDIGQLAERAGVEFDTPVPRFVM
jgi:hypothetical protein